MATLHLFNPGHDIALASGLVNFTPPLAARRLRLCLGFLPSLWAKEGDCVLVDDVAAARESLQQTAIDARRLLGIDIGGGVEWSDSNGTLDSVDAVEPWGWNVALRERLRRMGVDGSVMPSDKQLQTIRELSHRRTAAQLLELLLGDRLPGITGRVPRECSSLSAVMETVAKEGRVVIKAPWSSSGRGVRLVCTDSGGGVGDDAMRPVLPTDGPLQGWLRNVLDKQGSVMVEPYYRKVMDFGMEFEAGADGIVDYCGLSLFTTACGAYTGNILATERAKRDMMGRYVPLDFLDSVRSSLCRHLSTLLKGGYYGPLGVDMMVCASGNEEGMDEGSPFLVHPCVEINLRRTMGHAALALTPADDDRLAVMQVSMSAPQHRALSLAACAPTVRWATRPR